MWHKLNNEKMQMGQFWGKTGREVHIYGYESYKDEN